MSELRKEVEQALDEGEIYDTYGARWGKERIEALRAALAQERSDVQPEPEHDVWFHGVQYVRADLADKRQPLTDDEIKCIKPVCADFVSFRAGVRQAEREHGIGV